MIPVVGYCRVSTDREDQASSFASQQRFFREYIEARPDWTLCGIYADEGVTGTSTKKRTEFNRMIADARAGKFRLILTKEVSRFSRNLLDTLRYTRELKQIGVGVMFLNDGFSSLDPDSELRLSIMGSIAQEESRKTSSRVKWGQQRQMERGVVFGPSMLGYQVRDGKMTIEPEGAEIVRLLFHKYGIEKKGASVIARELREKGYRTYSGGTDWSSSQILKLLRNEKYVGDLVQKKTITPDYLTHAKQRNRGEEELIVIENHHAPIIDRPLWDTVQAELQKRSGSGSGHSNRHIFSGRIICGECGGKFVSRRKTRKNGTSYMRWCCYTAATGGGCSIGRTIRDELAMEALKLAIGSIPVDREQLIGSLCNALCTPRTPSEAPRDTAAQLRQLQKKKENAIDAFLSGTISREELQQMKERYDQRITQLSLRLRSCASVPTPAPPGDRQQLLDIINDPTAAAPLCRRLLESLTIHKDGTFQLRLCHLPQVWHFEIQYHRASP